MPQQSRIKVLVVIGTRPEAIKLAPVIAQFRDNPQRFDVRVCLTGQHKELLEPALETFDIRADYRFKFVKEEGGLGFATRRILRQLEEVFREFRADGVVVQGDTTTTFAASLAAFYSGIRVAHVEAGLRSGNINAPWPEEANRRLTSVVASVHFAPTARARQNLLDEGIPVDRIDVTGNTIVDALLHVIYRIKRSPQLEQKLARQFEFLNPKKKVILVTGHRRESFGSGIVHMCEAIRALVQMSDAQIVFPVHLNPQVREPVRRKLSQFRDVWLIEPVPYEAFVYLMLRSSLILTDSGGVQEEAPTLGVPVLIMRDVTERTEAVEIGSARLVGTDPARIVSAAIPILRSAVEPESWTQFVPKPNPFGDGQASAKIVSRLLAQWSV